MNPFGRNPKRKHMYFYNRLMIVYTIIFLAVTYVSVFFFTQHYIGLATVDKLGKSREALSAVSRYYEEKQEALPNLILPLYKAGDNIDIEQFFHSPADDLFNDPTSKKELCDLLQEISSHDLDIKEILLYKDINGSKYVYNRMNKTIIKVSGDYPFFDTMETWRSSRINVGTRQISGNDGMYAEDVYGIGGVIGRNKDGSTLGKFLIAYDTEAFDYVLQRYSDTYGWFVIISSGGDIVFDSAEDGENTSAFPYMDALASGEQDFTFEGRNYYIQQSEGKNTDVIYANITLRSELIDSHIFILVYGVVTAMAVLCIILYMLVGHFISRRILLITLAMNKVGLNDLTYRIPVGHHVDEFEQIAVNYNEMCDRLQQTIASEYAAMAAKAKAEINTLQAGINPHFLYNTLEVIRVMAIEGGNQDVSRMIVNLANLYRVIVKEGNFIPIRSEVNNCEMYMDIFSLRYGDNLAHEIDIGSEIMGFSIPKNLLQPIIENYFVHGIRDNSYENRFSIRGFKTGNAIFFVFKDNGFGIDEIHLNEINKNLREVTTDSESGYGLYNIQKRIRLIYGEPYGLTIESVENELTMVTVMIKAITCEEV